jgi:hypothetical protein
MGFYKKENALMKKKILLLISVIILFFIICLFLTEKRENSFLNLVFSNKEVIIPEHFDTLEEKILKKEKDIKIFKERLNIFFPPKKLERRFKFGGISYQGLIIINRTKIIYDNLTGDYNTLKLSLLNGNNSKQIYKIYIKNRKTGEIKNLFKEYIGSEKLKFVEIDLKNVDLKRYKIIFETMGKGVGAWINPLLIKKKYRNKVVVLIVLDTLRADHTTVYGYKRDTTPNLMKLAKDGVIYENAYSTSSWTLPAHTSLFSGKNLLKHKVISPNNKISEDLPLITELLQKKGYQTFAFTGGGFVEDNYGFAKGFQYYSNLPGNVFSMNSANRVFIHFINKMKNVWGTDLFVFLHTYQLHSPYKAPHKFFNHFNKKLDKNLIGIKNYIKDNTEYYKSIPKKERRKLIDLYDGAIYYADSELIGKTIALLKKRELYDDAMIIVLSDHGEEFYDHNSWEHGHSLYRELIKIPLIIKYPKNKKRGVEKKIVSIKDIAGLIAATIGGGTKIFRNNISENRELKILLPVSPIIKQFSQKISFIDSKYHFIFNIKKGEDFFNPAPKTPIYELYNISDKGEKNNLIKNKQNSKVLKKFIRESKQLLKIVNKLNKNKNKISRELMKKLKSLGYLK